MPRKGDREILVDPPPKLDLDGVAKSSSIPETLTSSNLKTFRSFRDWLCGDLSSTSNQLQIIYISIAACLAAISFALLLAIFFGPQQVTPHGFFVSDFSSCSRLGKELMVSKGGNAVDALISIVLCLSVTRQDIISLGGCGAFWVHQRDTGSNSLFDAMCSSPNSIENDLQNSAQTVSVPGLVAGLKSLHDKYGYLYWSNLFHSAIVRAEEGFSVHPDLRANLEKVAADNSHPASQFANNQLSALVNKTWGPQFELEETLKTLAADGAMPFYNGSIGDSIVSALSPHNVTWEIKKDLGAYQVLNPQHITLGLAGFNVRGFPAPFVGGTLTTSVLANLDLLNHQRPLNARKLAQNDAEELSVLYHRLIELNKLGSSQISTLGDPYTSVEGKSVADLEKNLLSLDARKKIVELVKDDRVLTTSECGEPDPLLFVTPETNTFVLTVESDMLIASAVLTLGGTAFGSGIVTPKTGILLNSAQLFFSSSSINKGANFAAPGRRPLLPTSPVFFETTQQQCGHRFLAASSGGIRGMMDISQVLTSSFLYLSNVSCKGGGDGQSSDKTVSKELPSVSETTVTYNPAVGACLPLNDSLALKRFSLQLSGQEFSVHLEPGFNRAIGEKLKKIGHNVVFDSKDERRPRVAAVGWTLYTTIGGVEEKDRDDSAWF
nr:gamma glutamyltranspeptidase 1 [Hymenolepis microstoma]